MILGCNEEAGPYLAADSVAHVWHTPVQPVWNGLDNLNVTSADINQAKKGGTQCFIRALQDGQPGGYMEHMLGRPAMPLQVVRNLGKAIATVTDPILDQVRAVPGPCVGRLHRWSAATATGRFPACKRGGDCCLCLAAYVLPVSDWCAAVCLACRLRRQA